MAKVVSLESFVALGAIWLLYGSLLVVYRLTLHPLKHFPGPKLAAATKWYEFYFDVLKGHGGQYAWEMRRMHEKYGSVVRINPDEVHIKDPDYYSVIYAGAPARRDKYLPAASMVGCPLGTFGTVEHNIYCKRRAANSVFFSKLAIEGAQQLIAEQVEHLCNNLRQQCVDGEVVDMHTVFLAFTTDAVCQFIFGKSGEYQHDSRKAADWKKTMSALPQISPLVRQFPWIVALSFKLPHWVVRWTVPNLARLLSLHKYMYDEAAEYLDHEAELCVQGPRRVKGNQLPRTIFHAIDQSLLPPDEKNLERLAQEGFVLISAGSDTTARAFKYAMYHLLANPTLLERLRQELQTVMPDVTSKPHMKVLNGLPFFTAVIKENLRIMSLITSRLPLLSSTELRYQDWTIPARTPVSMTISDMLSDPIIYPNPEEFIPDRWLANGKIHRNLDQYFVPFGRGPRMCQGINFAWAELYIALATILRRFRFELYETRRERDVDIVRDCFFGEADPKSPGIRMKVVGIEV